MPILNQAHAVRRAASNVYWSDIERESASVTDDHIYISHLFDC